MIGSCMRVRQWVHEADLDQARRLRVDDHLATCDACRAAVAFDRGLFGLAEQDEATGLTELSRRRVVSRALMAAGAGSTAAQPGAPDASHWNLRWSVAAGATLAGSALLALLVFGWGPIGSQGPGLSAASEPASVNVVAPRVAEQSAPVDVRAVESEPTPAWVAVDSSVGWRAPGVVVAAAANGVELRHTAGTLEIRGGVARIEVDAPQEIQIRTAQVSLFVAAARFELGAAGVEVYSGIVRVVQPGADGRGVSVSKGEEWPPAGRAASAARPASATRAARSAGQGLGASELRTARRLLADGDPKAAEALATRVLRGVRERGLRAEAATLRAESSAQRGRVDEALARYAGVSTRYAAQPAAQNASFAAAQLAARAGRRAQARELWQRYLERYPSGTFAAEARRRLAE